MNKIPKIAIDIALIHFPVVGKYGENIGSAVTNLDLHDIARASKTYGVNNYYIVTPYQDQQKLVQEIIDHWQTGHGSTANPARKAAFSVVQVSESLDNVLNSINKERGVKPVLVMTSAKKQKKTISFNTAKKKIESGVPHLLLFGTAHGLSEEITENVDYILPPLGGHTEYNHLSVRSAAAIILDRLLGKQE